MSESVPRAQRIVLLVLGVGFFAVAVGLGIRMLAIGIPDTPWAGRAIIGMALAVLVPAMFGVLFCALAVSGEGGFR